MIHKLDERISNMIAAGEVVTRPASALKELLENAIDAKATKIDIDLIGSGLKEMRVIDNGSGMSPEDVKLAFFRHATSKIKTEYDLNHIMSLGFRGEAIPAIASVSKMTIKSKMKDSSGYEVSYEGGRFKEEKPSALNTGTEVIVEDLFYNVPARLKHIRSPQTELSYLREVVDEMMLSHPNIAFKLTHENRILRQSFGTGNQQDVIQIIYGTDAAKDLLSSKFSKDDINITLSLVTPKITKTRKNDIHIILNGRIIKNYVLINSVIEGYHTHLMTQRYPISVVRIDIDPSLIDVNIHPQKREVKISNEYLLASLIRSHIRSVLVEKPKATYRDNTSYEQISSFDYVIEELKLNYEAEKPQEISTTLPYFEYIGQFSGTYLLFQNEEGLYMIDQHAAAERIRYEVYYEKLGKKTALKPLLFPMLVEYRPTEEAIIERHLKDFESIGLILEKAGPTGYFLKEMPVWLDDEDAEGLIEEAVISLEHYGTLNLSDLRDNLSKSIACKGAIKANKPLNKDEVLHLMDELRKTKNPHFCPHGRPVMIFYSHYEIEKMFKRIV